MYNCRNFQSKSPQDRIQMLTFLRICHRCLRNDSNLNITARTKWWDDHKAACITDYACRTDNCAQRDQSQQRHICMCMKHSAANASAIATFISTLDQSKLIPNLSFFYLTPGNYTTEYKVETVKVVDGVEILPDRPDIPPIYMVQAVKGGNGVTLLVFYDSGCTGASMSSRAYKVLECETVREGPTLLNVASGRTLEIKHGDERFSLELTEPNRRATITALRMDDVTNSFPNWETQEAFEEISRGYEEENPEGEPLPQVDRAVGGSPVDIMIGIRYNQYFPQLRFMLPSGLAIYEARFKSASGNQGVLGGSHASWKNASDRSLYMGPRAYFTSEYRAYNSMNNVLTFRESFSCPKPWQEERLVPDGRLPTYRAQETPDLTETVADRLCPSKHCSRHSQEEGWLVPQTWELGDTIFSAVQDENRFWDIENAGTSVEYRCISCRNCARCRSGDANEKVSLQEEREQAMIEDLVTLNVEKKVLEAGLPFIENPAEALKPNRHIAEKVFEAQMRLIQKNPEMHGDVMKSHAKLRDNGCVFPISEIPAGDLAKMDTIPGPAVFLPWQVVTKANSLSTKARMVYNGSSCTPSGKSINSILAKGENRLAKIVDVLLQFRNKPFAFTGDVKMAYNGVRLRPEYYKFQQYLWKEGLDPKLPFVVMIIVTLIYGIKSAGQQTIAGFCKLADECAENHPEHYDGAETLRRNSYMDDILMAVRSLLEAQRISKSLAFTLALGSLQIKCFTFSGETPSEEVSADGQHVGLIGYLWDPKRDEVKLDIKALYFGKAKRGKLPEPVAGEIRPALQNNFTRRNLVGKCAGVYDPLGLVTPITAKLKLDLHELSDLKLDWDDQVPACYLDLWTHNLRVIGTLADVIFPRAVVPKDAASEEFELLVLVDASAQISIATVYARSLKKDGTYYCQLMAAKSKLTKGVSIPRGELKSAVLGTVLGHIVKRNSLEHFKNITYVTDSTICLFWINQDYRPLQVAVRNSVIEIRRFSLPEQWFHVESENNIADLGTRTAEVDQIMADSEWQKGKPWMSYPWEEIYANYLRTPAKITLSSMEKIAASKEMKATDVGGHHVDHMIDKLGQRYSYSKYAVDPCYMPWPRALRVVATLYRIADMARKKPVNLTATFTDAELERAELYFMRKGTLEVEQFAKEKDYKNITIKKDKLLLYTGRMLEGQEFNAMENVMLDVTPTHFVKPVLDRYSPVAYSLMVHCHAKLTNHKNNLATLRESMNHAYIIGGRDLATEIRNSCPYCRRYLKKLMEAELGPVHKNRLTVAPAFYYSQVDIFGPYMATSEHNFRSKVKVWGLVFKCPSTCAVSIHAMAKYDTTAFLFAYTRFSKEHGHPKKLFIDEGSQLKKGCKEMELSMVDITRNLDVNYSVGIDYETCPVGAHYQNGVVERAIKEIKKLFNVTFRNIKMTILMYETAFA